MQCKNCGAILDAQNDVCPNCGVRVNVDVDNSQENLNVQLVNDVPIEESPVQEPINIVPPVQNIGNISEDVAVFNNNYEQKKSKKGIVAFIVTLVILVVGLLGFTFYITRTPKMVFNGFVNKLFKEVESSMVDFDTMKGSLTLQTSLSTNDESSEILDIINDIFVSIDYEIDYTKKDALLGINTKYDNDKLLNLDVYLKDNKGYVLLEDLYDKYISVDVGDIDSLFETTDVKDSKTVFSEVRSAITKSLKNEYFTKSKEEITIDGKKVEVTKNILSLDKNGEAIAKDVLTYLNNSDKFVESFSNISKLEKNEIKSMIEEELKSLEGSNSSVQHKVSLSIYTKGLMNEVVGVELSYVEGDDEMLIRFIEESDNNFVFELSAEEKLKGKVKLTENADKTIIDFEMSDETVDNKIGLTITSYVDYGSKLSSVNVTNSVDVNELTEEDQTEIVTKLMENQVVQKLMEQIGGLSFGNEDDIYNDDDYYYEDDYYYDEDDYYYEW